LQSGCNGWYLNNNGSSTSGDLCARCSRTHIKEEEERVGKAPPEYHRKCSAGQEEQGKEHGAGLLAAQLLIDGDLKAEDDVPAPPAMQQAALAEPGHLCIGSASSDDEGQSSVTSDGSENGSSESEAEEDWQQVEAAQELEASEEEAYEVTLHAQPTATLLLEDGQRCAMRC
jgi:hypothetical protein